VAGSARARTPVKVGAHREIEEQIGSSSSSSSPSSSSPEDLDPLPPGWKSSHEQELEEEERERALRREYRSQERSRARAQNRPPAAPKSAPRRSSRPAPRSGRRPPARRTVRPTLGNPTGNRLPISFDGEGVAGFFFGAVFYALVLSVVEYGSAGPGYWFKAKFLNKPAPARSK
jgi:hypothetical protein